MAYLALYRKWRPRVFGEIIGQEHITRTLQNAVAAGRVGHAYLFCGTRGTGKTSTAKVLAKAINCLNREGPEPCNCCDSCDAVNEGVSVDVIEVDAASNRGIDEIRDLREKIRFAPAAGNYRVYIIDEVHMLTNEAFNALLKTLEEPPRHGVLILATTEPHKVPLTILSRCQRFDFRRIVPADIMARLKEVAAGAGLEVEEEALRLIARAAEGGLRDALSILDQAAAFGQLTITAEDVHSILGTVRVEALGRAAACLAAGDAGAALRLVGELTAQGKDLRIFARELAGYLRALLLEKISPGAAAGEAWEDPARLAAGAADFTREGLLRVVEIIAGAEPEMKWSTLPGVVLEVALVKACRPDSGADLAALAARLAGLEQKVNELAAGDGPGVKGRSALVPPASGAKPLPKSKESYQPASPGPAGKAAVPKTAGPAGAKSGRSEKGPEAGQLQDRAAEQSQPDEMALEQVKKAWGSILEALRSERLPLYPSYVKAVPLLVKGRGLVVGFPEGDALAREMSERPGNKKYLEELLGRFLGGEWQAAFKFYQGRVSQPEVRPAAAREPAADVSRRFGGEEIDLDEDKQGSLF